jgi:hypothetical protein
MTPSLEKLFHIRALVTAGRVTAIVADSSQPGCRGLQVSAECYIADGAVRIDQLGVRSEDDSWFVPWPAIWGIVDCDGPNDASAMRTWPKPPRPSRLPDGWRAIKGGAS